MKMNINFRLSWASGAVPGRNFKSAPAGELFGEYLKRLGRYSKTAASAIDLKKPEKGRAIVWFCDFSKTSRAISSEDLAKELEKVRRSGRDWEIVIGPADGFSAQDIERWKPDLLWSFGPITLPHELAAVVAAEQVYRASTILAGQPYHSGH